MKRRWQFAACKFCGRPFVSRLLPNGNFTVHCSRICLRATQLLAKPGGRFAVTGPNCFIYSRWDEPIECSGTRIGNGSFRIDRRDEAESYKARREVSNNRVSQDETNTLGLETIAEDFPELASVSRALALRRRTTSPRYDWSESL